MSARLWYLAVGAAVLGTALVFAGVGARGPFTAGVILIDGALLAAATAGLLELRSPPARES